MRSPAEVACQGRHTYASDPKRVMPALATWRPLALLAPRGLWRFPRVVDFPYVSGADPCGDDISHNPFKQVAKVAKVANKEVKMTMATTYEVASSGGDLATPEEVATAFPCVRCSAPAGPSALLCPACYAEKRPPKCPACGGRLVDGKCGWC